MKPFLLLLLLPPIAAAAEIPQRTLCAEFQKLLEKPTATGIETKLIEKSIPIGGTEGDARYFNIDIDGDDIGDTVQFSCSASLVPADPCQLSIALSSGGKIEFSEDRFFLVRHRARIYAVAAEIGPKRPKGAGKVFRVEPRGVLLVCPNI